MGKPSVGVSGQASWGRCPLRMRTVGAGSLPFTTGPRRGTHTATVGPALSPPCLPLPSRAVGVCGPECGISSPIAPAQKPGLCPWQAGPCRDAWTGRDNPGRKRPSSGRSDQCPEQAPRGPSSGSVVGGEPPLIGWMPASASHLSCHILFSAWK